MRTLSRDPFARLDIVRDSVDVHYYRTCDYCGSHGKKLVSGFYRLFVYGVYHDDKSRPNWDDKLFCCKSCHDSYYS